MRILCLLERRSRQICLIRSNIFVLLRPFLNRGILPTPLFCLTPDMVQDTRILLESCVRQHQNQFHWYWVCQMRWGKQDSPP